MIVAEIHLAIVRTTRAGPASNWLWSKRGCGHKRCGPGEGPGQSQPSITIGRLSPAPNRFALQEQRQSPSAGGLPTAQCPEHLERNKVLGKWTLSRNDDLHKKAVTVRST